MIPVDEAATSINIYFTSVAQGDPEKKLASIPANSTLARAIRSGPVLPEESILLSFSAKDILQDGRCVNAAIPHPFRASQFRNGTARLIGSLSSHSSPNMDESLSTVGGGAIVLKLIDLAQTPDELACTLNILRDLIKDSWKASEEMERIRESCRDAMR